jgi:hypothetical protein
MTRFLRKEGYNIEEIKESIYFWNGSSKLYKDFNNKNYQNLLKKKNKNARLKLISDKKWQLKKSRKFIKN